MPCLKRASADWMSLNVIAILRQEKNTIVQINYDRMLQTSSPLILRNSKLRNLPPVLVIPGSILRNALKLLFPDLPSLHAPKRRFSVSRPSFAQA